MPSLNWIGKDKVVNHHLDVPYRVLEHQYGFDNGIENSQPTNSGNKIIHGDNLEALKSLLPEYEGKIKCIYIDPPYNTGNENWVYNDNVNDPKIKKWLGEVVGKESEDLTRHDKWLCMMYPRLKLLHKLLADDGAIFISIDDNESSNTRKILDEIFGENNLVGEFIVVRAEGGGLAKQVIKGHDYLYVFAKNINNFNPLLRPKDIRGKIVTKDNEEYWIEEDWLRKEFGKYGTCPYNEIEKYFNIDKKIEINNGLKNGDYVLLNKNGVEIVGRYRKISEDGSKFYSILKHLNKTGIEELQKLNLDSFFDFPKPLSLLKELILGATFFKKDKSNFILDFFSGSGTTAHAVMQLNSEDGGNRKCISVQLPEPTDEKSEAFKANYKTIAEITKERIRRAGKLIYDKQKLKIDELKQKNSLLQEDKDKIVNLQTALDNLDIGFKAFKLDSSNIVAWDGNPDNLEASLDLFENNIKPNRSEEDILFEILLKYGLDLTVTIEEKTISNKKVYSIGAGTIFICLANDITPAVSEGIGVWKEELNPTRSRVIFKDTGFENDKNKTNAMQILKRFGIEEVNSI